MTGEGQAGDVVRLTAAERETVRHCPECGHDWSGHPDDPALAVYFPCRGQRGLGSVSGCRCTLTLAGHVVALVAAARAEGVRALLAAAEGDQFPNPSSVPLRRDNGYVSMTTLRHRAARLTEPRNSPAATTEADRG